MKSYINKNVGGGYDGWTLVPVSEETIKKAKNETFSTNLDVIDMLKEQMPDKEGYTEGERLAMFNQLTRHFHFLVENMVDEKIASGELNKNKIITV